MGRGDWGARGSDDGKLASAVNPRQHSQPAGRAAAEWSAAVGTHSLRLAVTLRCAWGTDAVRLDPIILHSWGQGFNLREEARNLPHFLLT